MPCDIFYSVYFNRSKLSIIALSQIISYYPSASAVEVIESEPSFCVCVCVCALSRLNRFTYGQEI